MIAKLREAVRAAIPEDKRLPQIRHGNRVVVCSRFNQGKDRP